MAQQARKVKFQPMSPQEFEQWYLLMVEEYAEDLAKSGRVSTANALETADKQTKKMLKDGLETENNDLYIVQDADSGERVGTLWLLYQEKEDIKSCFIAEIRIEMHCRRQGYGRATMLHCEVVAKAENAHSISLHVFGFNAAAIALYSGIGYESTNIQMEKVLG